MSEVISLINEKGGVGKSTSAITIAQILAISGYQVLLIDLDPQMNTTKMFGKDEDNSNINYEHLFCEKQLRESSVLTSSVKQITKIFQYCLHQEELNTLIYKIYDKSKEVNVELYLKHNLSFLKRNLTT